MNITSMQDHFYGDLAEIITEACGLLRTRLEHLKHLDFKADYSYIVLDLGPILYPFSNLP